MNWREKKAAIAELEEIRYKFYASKRWTEYRLCDVLMNVLKEVKTEQ